MNFRKLHHVAYALVDLDRQVGIVISVPPEVYELVRLIVHIAMDFGLSFARKRIISIFASYTVRPKRRAHDPDQPHDLPQLLAFGIVSVMGASKWLHQGWLSGGCYSLPPPAPLLFLRCTKAFVMSLSSLKHV